MNALRQATKNTMTSKVSLVVSNNLNYCTMQRASPVVQLVLQPKLLEDHVPKAMRRSFSNNMVSSTQEQMFPDTTKELGMVTRTLKALDSSVVQQIEMELSDVDKDADGRIDSNDLKLLLGKHHSAFTDEEIIEFSELVYAGKAGGTISIPDLIEALDEAAIDKPERSSRHHPLLDGNCSAEYIYRKSHGYDEEDLDIKLTHVEPTNALDKSAFNAVKVVRAVFDTATGWNNDTIAQGNVLNRVIFLETIAAVPGMVAAIVRHFRSLRRMERDGGLMHLFLEEANNERMHLLSFIRMKDPSTIFRVSVILSQFGFGSFFLFAYLVSPKFCHRFVGYIEEEACHTYTKIIKAIEEAPEGSDLHQWNSELAPKIARGYWKLGESGTVLDLMYAVRADEAEHRDVNHACSELQDGQTTIPWNDPDLKVHHMLKKYVKDIMARDNKKNITVE